MAHFTAHNGAHNTAMGPREQKGGFVRFKKRGQDGPQTGKKIAKKIAPKHIWSWTYCPLSCIHHGNKLASVSDTLGGVAVVEINQRYRA